MSEFINEFGKENFYILITIVIVILIALFLIIIFEKHSAKKVLKEQLDNMKNNPQPVKREAVINKIHDEEPVEVLEEHPEEEQPVKKEEVKQTKNEVYYVHDDNPQETAKEKLEEVTRRLIDEDESLSLIDHTHFEEEQEEKSIISYDELVKASHDIDQKNDKLLEDEGEAAITLEELYNKYAEEQNVIEEETSSKEIKTTNPVFEEEPRKFKNSDVISPVFGVYTGKEKPKVEVLKDIDKEVGQADLEDEIKRTEDFLHELKRLKSKLD